MQKVSISKDLLIKLLDYCEPDEERHYEEVEEDCTKEQLDNHIYTTIMVLRQEVDK